MLRLPLTGSDANGADIVAKIDKAKLVKSA
jgi:hypothetical protein